MELGHALVIFQSLILICAANGAPVLFARLLGTRFARPIDGGIVLRDGHPLLGRSKTWRGLAAAVVLAACAAVLIGLPWQAGALIGASAMAGDCLSSFVKRRLALEASSMSLGLDQVPESLLPAVASSVFLPLAFGDVSRSCWCSPSESSRCRVSSTLSAYGIDPTKARRAQVGAG